MLLTAAPTALARHAELDVDVDARADMSLAAEARAQASGRVRYTWDWGDGTSDVGARARHEYRAPGVYRVAVTATDEAGHEWRRAREVEVRAPPTRTELDVRGAQVRAEADVDARTRVTWDWGDGEVSVGRRATHRYERAGTYEVEATFERRGQCWTERRVVVVEGEARDEDEERDEDEPRRDGVSVRAPGVSARVSWGHDHDDDDEDDDEARFRSRSDARVSSSSYERHDVPGAPVGAVLAAVAGLALAARALRRR